MVLQYLFGKKNEFEAIFNSNYVVNIQDRVHKGFVSRERAYTMVVDAYFIPRRTNRPNATLTYEPVK